MRGQAGSRPSSDVATFREHGLAGGGLSRRNGNKISRRVRFLICPPADPILQLIWRLEDPEDQSQRCAAVIQVPSLRSADTVHHGPHFGSMEGVAKGTLQTEPGRKIVRCAHTR